jgi:hypothetical protein
MKTGGETDRQSSKLQSTKLQTSNTAVSSLLDGLADALLQGSPATRENPELQRLFEGLSAVRNHLDARLEVSVRAQELPPVEEYIGAMLSEIGNCEPLKDDEWEKPLSARRLIQFLNWLLLQACEKVEEVESDDH